MFAGGIAALFGVAAGTCTVWAKPVGWEDAEAVTRVRQRIGDLAGADFDLDLVVVVQGTLPGARHLMVV